ncbi:MAG: S9 family peptidase [Isosphaeraceae bacterium]|nr:S9 family peptidase [Isosphaeraceae bacterium]
MKRNPDSSSRLIPLLLSIAGCIAVPTLAEDAKRPMTAEDLWKLERLGAPSISPDGNRCVVEVTTWDLEKSESRSRLWLISTDGKSRKPLTNPEGKAGGPRWSPDGTKIAFVSKRAGDESPQIYVISPDGGEALRVGTTVIPPSGLKWASDSKRIYYIGWTWPDAADQAAHDAKRKALESAKSKAMIIDDAQYRTWDKWITDGRRPMIFTVDLETGTHANLLTNSGRFLPPTEPGPSAADFDVSPDGAELCFTSDSAADYGTDYNSDIYTLALDGRGAVVKGARPKNLTSENLAGDSSPVYSPDGKHLAFLRRTIKDFYADRSRLMVLDRGTGAARELTAGFDRSCNNPKWVDAGRIAVEAENAGVTGIYFVDLAGKLAPIPPPAESESSIDFAKSRRMAVYLVSSFDRPAALYAHGPGMREPISLEDFNAKLISQWKLGKVESRNFKGAGDATVQQWIVYPPDFDANRKWPFVQVVHGGPHNGITNDWSYRWNLQLWAAQGYVIGCVNFHGSSGFGQAFTDSITGALGDKPFVDLERSTDWFASQKWIDPKRMAAAGASYGGYMMAWLNGHTDRYRAMVCHAGVYDWHAMLASDIVKGRDRSLGAPPWGDLSIVDRQSAQRFAKNFKTPTLVLHGERDFRVPITQGLAYYNTLRQKGVPTRLVYFPDENHWVLSPHNSIVWHREVFAWLEKYLSE